VSGIDSKIGTTGIPPIWRDRLDSQLESGEHVHACFEPDLDAQLDFADGLVVLTDRRLLAVTDVERRATTGAAAATPRKWRSWPIAPDSSLRTRESAGVGVLEFIGPNALEASWAYTMSKSPSATQFVQTFKDTHAAGIANRKSKSGAGARATICPSCGAKIEPPQTVCEACTPTAAPPPVRSLWRLGRFAKPRAAMIAFGFALTIASISFGLVPNYLTILLLHHVLIPQQNGLPVDSNLVPWYIGAMFGAGVLAWMLSWAKTYVLSRVSERVSADLRVETYAHLQRLSLEFFGGKRTGDLIARVGSDTDRICTFLSVNLLDFCTDILMIVMTAVVLFKIDVNLALVAFLPFPFIAWMGQRVRVRLRHGFAHTGAAWAEMVNVLADTIPGIRVVKAFAQEKREIERFKRRNQHVFDANNRVNILWSFFGPTVTLLTDCATFVIWGYAAWQVFHQSAIDVAVLIGFIGYMGRLYTRLESMSRFVASTQRAAAATHRVFEILDRRASVADPVKPVHPGRLHGKIELNNISFKYGNRTVIRDVSLTIEPGEMIGLVGPSGSGKSTLVNLICRFYDVAAGAIAVDGYDIRSFPVEEYRGNIGIVLQEPFLFYGTIAENIAYGRPEASRAEVVAAARAARAHEFILNLPDGYDSVVGERGQSLSGGERQRISIARALLTDPRILILDEATSSVDNETEREIQEALQNLIEGRTTIAIAHRISTLRKANRLVVLEAGEITAVGSHEDLVQTSATYARLQSVQRELEAGAGV
jgi:ATP-binding cassette subfamily B protein